MLGRVRDLGVLRARKAPRRCWSDPHLTDEVTGNEVAGGTQLQRGDWGSHTVFRGPDQRLRAAVKRMEGQVRETAELVTKSGAQRNGQMEDFTRLGCPVSLHHLLVSACPSHASFSARSTATTCLPKV